MQSNPIQQRIDLICEKWEDAKKKKDARVVNIRCQPDEDEMVDVFYTYMIGVDSPITDIAFHFDSDCNDPRQYSTLMLDELKETMHIWNNFEKDERIEFVPVDWKPDRTLKADKNPAAMFVQNFNALAKAMNLPEGIFAVAVLKKTGNKKNFISWLKDAIEAGISKEVKFLLHDRFDIPTMDEIILSAQGPYFVTIPLNLNMPKAMEQVAAMGDPNDPATGYRLAFMKMMNEMTAGNESKAEKAAQECIKIATNTLAKDPFWITQIVVIYTALANDKIRYKKETETLEYANKALATAKESQAFFENNVTAVLVSQTTMFRGTVYFTQGKKYEAYADFKLAFDSYKEQGNLTMAIEAARMAGESAVKFPHNEEAIQVLATAARFGENLEPKMAAATTYPGAIDILLQTNHAPYISIDELNRIVGGLFGDDWVTKVKNWKQVPDVQALKKKEREAAEA